jgi:hypothetical protein
MRFVVDGATVSVEAKQMDVSYTSAGMVLQFKTGTMTMANVRGGNGTSTFQNLEMQFANGEMQRISGDGLRLDPSPRN